MMRRGSLWRVAALALALGLAGCGTERPFLADQVAEGLTGLAQGRGEPEPPLRARLTREVLAALDGPILLVELRNTESEAGAQLARVSGDLETWSTLNNIQFVFDQGVLTATRGIPGDLMRADLREVTAALAAGGGAATRIHRYLDGEDQQITRAYLCEIASAGRVVVDVHTGRFTTRKLTETCVSQTEAIENQYWIDSRGLMRRSVQWVGPDAGYIVTERIND